MRITTKEPKTSLPTRGRRGQPIDVVALAKALSIPGIDPRGWIHAGTVGTQSDDGKTFNTRDPEAVWVDRRGCVVSVRLEPQNQVVHARYNGISCGDFGSILVPIRPGADVLVLVPDGDFNSPDVTVVGMASGQLNPIPEDWNNDRVLMSLNVPLEIRSPSVSIRGGTLTLNGRLVSAGPSGI